MAKSGTETLTVTRATASEDDDFYGDAPSGDPVTVASTETAVVWPRAAEINTGRGIVTIEGLSIFVADGELEWHVPDGERDIREKDRIHVRGKDWMLEGVVGDWRKKNGDRVGDLFNLTRWSG